MHALTEIVDLNHFQLMASHRTKAMRSASARKGARTRKRNASKRKTKRRRRR